MISQVQNIEYYITLVNAYVQSSKHEETPFDPTIINKILNNYAKIKNDYLTPTDFQNIIYLLMEEQSENGYIISPKLRSYIDHYRENRPSNFFTDLIEYTIIYMARNM